MPSEKTSGSTNPYRSPVLLVVLTLIMVVVIEISHPFFFLQDDNRTLYLPFYVHNLRALFGGEFPFYNFHQYLGTPVTIQYAALYPVNYLSLCLSKLVLGNFFGAMEIIALFHLVTAVLGFYSLMRLFDLEETSCFFGAFTWAFCGFVITVGNSWIQTVGFAAYLPWILLFSIKQTYRFELRNFLILAVLKVCELLLGYPQLFVYTLTFEFLTVVLLFATNRQSGAMPVNAKNAAPDRPAPPSFGKVMLSFAANYAAVVIIALPLVLQTIQQTGVSANRKQLLSWEEYAAYSYDLKYWLHGLLAPFKAVDVTTQFDFHCISHIGYLTLVFILLAMLPFIRITADSGENLKNGSKRPQVLVFGLLALLSLLWAGDIIITRILYYLPVYNRLRFPFKVGFFTSFYLVIIATYGFDSCYTALAGKRGGRRNVATLFVVLVLLSQVANFIVLYALLPQQMFSRHLDPVPIVEPLRTSLADGRIVSASLDEVWDGDKIVPGFSAALLGYDYATLWGLFHFGGYDPMVSAKSQATALGIKNNPVFNLPANEPFTIPAETLEYFRKWGVKWYVVNKEIPLRENDAFILFHGDEKRNVLLDPLAKPLVYWQHDPYKNNTLKYEFRSNSVTVDYSSEAGGTLIINVLQHPFFTATLDGAAMPITETADSQVALSVPSGRHAVILTYKDRNFLYGSVISALFMLVVSACFFFKRAKNAITAFMS